MKEVKHTNYFFRLWNDLPLEERERLMPHMIECQKSHILHCKQKAIIAHRRHMKDLNNWLRSIDDELNKIRQENLRNVQ